jgi:hypothetical protein
MLAVRPANLLALAAALLGAGCGLFSSSTRQEAPQPKAAEGEMQAEVETKAEGELLVRTYDLNGDKRADDWKYFKLVPDPKDPKKPIEVLVRRELDTNFDGKVDIWTWFNDDGTKLKEQFDLDFDGRPDVIDYYEKGVLIRKEAFHGASRTPDQVTHYENGKKARIERDTKGAGRIDTWEYFEDGKLVRIGQDLDGDGTIDRWVKAKEEDEEEPAAKKPQPKKAAGTDAKK